jgi:hypothetical protein
VSLKFELTLDPLDGTAALRHGTLFVFLVVAGQQGVLSPDHSLRCEGRDMLRGPGALVACPPKPEA